jgi:carbohydrate-selective porin OprB
VTAVVLAGPLVAAARAQQVTVAPPPTDPNVELADIEKEKEGALHAESFERPFAWLARKSTELEAASGLKLGLAYTTLFQQASNGPGDRNGGAGDVDLFARWTALGRGTPDTGTFVLNLEQRQEFGSQTPAELGPEIGTLNKTTNAFTKRELVVKDGYFAQRLFDDRLRLGIGRADPENLVGGMKYQSQNVSFLNQAFSTNPTISFPGSGATFAASVRPGPFYVSVGAVNAYSQTTQNTLHELVDERKFFTFAEGGWLGKVGDLGSGTYRVAVWHIDEREKTGKPSDRGITLVADQDFGASWAGFARYGRSEGRVAVVQELWEAGVLYKGLFGLKEDLTGLAAASSEPRDDAIRTEKVIEVFHRFQLNPQWQLSLGAQLILDPGKAPDDDPIGVFSFRVRVAF